MIGKINIEPTRPLVAAIFFLTYIYRGGDISPAAPSPPDHQGFPRGGAKPEGAFIYYLWFFFGRKLREKRIDLCSGRHYMAVPGGLPQGGGLYPEGICSWG